MPGQDIDDATLPVVRERDLGPHNPAADPRYPANEVLRQRSVRLVRDALEEGASGARQQLDPDLERPGNGADGLELQCGEVAALDAGHRRIGDLCRSRDVRLAQ